MVIIKILFLAGFITLASASDSEAKPTMATLQIQPNFDFSLTRKEFRVHYSGVGEDFKDTTEDVFIKIYKKEGATSTQVHKFQVEALQKNAKKAYQFALDTVGTGAYEVEVCVGDDVCSGKTPSLTDITGIEEHKLKCNRGKMQDGKWVPASEGADFELDFVGPSNNDWIALGDFSTIEQTVNTARRAVGQSADYKTDYTIHNLNQNPTYKHSERLFYAGIRYNVTQYRKLFDRMVDASGDATHEFCERKYLLSAHAHIVRKNTKEVIHRFKTTLFLSAGGKKLFVLNDDAQKVHVELTHTNANIAAGSYDLHISFCATEKDEIESTFCTDPIVKDFTVTQAT